MCASILMHHHLSSSIINVSRLLLANETIFSDNDYRQMVEPLICHYMVEEVEVISEVKVNIWKRTTLPIGEGIISSRLIGCSIDPFPKSYLGHPLRSKLKEKFFRELVMNRFEMKVSDRKFYSFWVIIKVSQQKHKIYSHHKCSFKAFWSPLISNKKKIYW